MCRRHLWSLVGALATGLVPISSLSAYAQTEARGTISIWTGTPGLPGKFVGSGFHIGNGTMVTARHVLDGLDDDWHVVVASKSAATNRVAPGKTACQDDVDLCFFKVDKTALPLRDLELSDPFLPACELVNPWPVLSMVGYSNESAKPKKYEKINIQGNTAEFVSPAGVSFSSMIETDAQTSPGLSGSPVFLAGTRLAIGLHAGFSKATQNQAITPFYNIRDKVQQNGEVLFDPARCLENSNVIGSTKSCPASTLSYDCPLDKEGQTWVTEIALEYYIFGDTQADFHSVQLRRNVSAEKIGRLGLASYFVPSTATKAAHMLDALEPAEADELLETLVRLAEVDDFGAVFINSSLDTFSRFKGGDGFINIERSDNEPGTYEVKRRRIKAGFFAPDPDNPAQGAAIIRRNDTLATAIKKNGAIIEHTSYSFEFDPVEMADAEPTLGYGAVSPTKNVVLIVINRSSTLNLNWDSVSTRISRGNGIDQLAGENEIRKRSSDAHLSKFGPLPESDAYFVNFFFD